jgi:N-acetylmuramoyl-L-alanine amidase
VPRSLVALAAALLSAAPFPALAAPRSRPARASPAPSFLVVVDPGHGGEKNGAPGPGGVFEKELVLQIGRRVAARLKKLGGRAVLTRTSDVDVPLAERAALANAVQADLFISVHLNSMPTRETRRVAHGIETYFLSADATDASAKAVAARENADRLAGDPGPDPANPVAGILDDLASQDSLAGSSRLAYAIHDALLRATGADDRGVKQAPFYVLAGARMPAVLVEFGFVSHPEESRRLRDPAYQDSLAEAVAAGVSAWRRASVAAAAPVR